MMPGKWRAHVELVFEMYFKKKKKTIVRRYDKEDNKKIEDW